MNQNYFKHFAVIAVLFLVGCANDKPFEIEVQNSLDIDRSFETVAVDLDLLKSDESLKLVSGKTYTIREVGSTSELVSQLSDVDGDGAYDVLLFQPEIGANSSKTYTISIKDIKAPSEEIPTCYSRFVPERTDDYAWENDRVAFRTYGPTAQKMIEDSIPGGTLSSGIDAWLKRVDYPIIDKWYKKELETDGSYHEDDGEGLDNFHVGTSRGVGGIAIKEDSTYVFSKNFTQYKTLEVGPIRTSFSLSYAPWNAAGKKIHETKVISLDRGSNLSKFKIEIEGVERFSVGLTLHEKDGEMITNEENTWVGYWEPHGDSELGSGIIVPSDDFLGFDEYITSENDLSNLYAQIKVHDGVGIYYAGFGWKKSEQFLTKDAWVAYLNQFSKKLESPLIINRKE